MNARPVEMQGIATIKASRIAAPPPWALMERRLFSLMEASARAYVSQYAERGGATLLAEDLDDLYEQFYNYGLFYALGASDDMLDLHLQQWNATNRISDQGFNHRPIHNEHSKKFTPSQYNEFWGMNHPMEWHHLGEGLMAWYDMGVADPTISENARRSRRFAGMYIGEDAEACLWDAGKRIIRSPFQSSQGPVLEGDVNWANTMLLAGRYLGGQANYYGVRASLYPVVKNLEARWFENPRRRAYIVDLFNKLVLQRDTPNTLAAAALVTDAYLYTGDDKYKQWALDYLEAWIDRTERNGGITPDNVDHQGVIGGGREGVFWGGQYGWNHYQGYNIMFHGINIAVECAVMLTGDFQYLDLLRSQLRVIVDAARIEDDGQLITPVRYGPDGWDMTDPLGPHENDGIPMRGVMQGPSPMRAQEMMHLYHASMAREDYEFITHIRGQDVRRDWNEVGERLGEKNSGDTEFARFQYYDGKNPDWPMQILSADYGEALKKYQEVVDDERSAYDIVTTNRMPQHVVLTKGLAQVTTGAPQAIYNGGLLRATVRYFDRDRGRPGLPPDTAALVDELRPDGVGVQLVNTNHAETRRVIVQAGAFGEHEFSEVRYRDEGGDGDSVKQVGGKAFVVELPPSTSIRLDAGMRRFVNRPSYAFPWHGDAIPVPFQ